MTTIMPQGDAIRNAVKWVSSQLQENPGSSPQKFVNEAVARFDLSPRDADFLIDFYRKASAEKPTGT
jgi:hypothetical protein